MCMSTELLTVSEYDVEIETERKRVDKGVAGSGTLIKQQANKSLMNKWSYSYVWPFQVYCLHALKRWDFFFCFSLAKPIRQTMRDSFTSVILLICRRMFCLHNFLKWALATWNNNPLENFVIEVANQTEAIYRTQNHVRNDALPEVWSFKWEAFSVRVKWFVAFASKVQHEQSPKSLNSTTKISRCFAANHIIFVQIKNIYLHFKCFEIIEVNAWKPTTLYLRLKLVVWLPKIYLIKIYCYQ